MGRKKTNRWWKLRESLAGEEIFHETEVQANKLGATILFNSGIILALILLLATIGVFPLARETILPPTVQGIVEVAVLIGICWLVGDDRWWLKYLLVIGLAVVYARLDGMLTHKAAILMVIPVVFSSRYSSRSFTIFTSLLVTVLFCLSSYWGATHGMINLNIVTMPAGTQLTATGGFLGTAVENAGVSAAMLERNTLLYDFLPKWLMFSITAVISSNIARRGREMVLTQHDKDIESARISTELHMATQIQESMLPNIFPAFPDRPEFDIYATMDPAREVGGDFYDFFLVDEDHLCMVMADVSGKGVPAALFMMASRIILANNAKMGKSPSEILTATNASICSNNRLEMFVTVWLGILEISTGKIVAANAGHEYPALRHAGGAFELLRDKHGFVVGGMDGIKYKEYELCMEPGARLFLYTDGVPEAEDAHNHMFGTERMLAALNASPDEPPPKLLANVRGAVDKFVNGAEQFDDLTMLCMEYKGTGSSVQEETE